MLISDIICILTFHVTCRRRREFPDQGEGQGLDDHVSGRGHGRDYPRELLSATAEPSRVLRYQVRVRMH